MRFIGPNCIGTMNLKDRVYCGFGSGFANPGLKAGPVAFVSQSGGFAFSVVGLADYEGIGFNYIVSAGNEAVTCTAAVLSVVMLLGGEPLGPRFIEWNFVSSSRARIDQAVADWRAGRMKLPDLDDKEFMPLPERPGQPAPPMS